jgi:hypothetical protein
MQEILRKTYNFKNLKIFKLIDIQRRTFRLCKIESFYDIWSDAVNRCVDVIWNNLSVSM